MKTILLALLAACVIIITAQAIQKHSCDKQIVAQKASIDSLNSQLGWYELQWGIGNEQPETR